MFNSDLTANRPAAGIVGRIFIAIDSPYGIFRDTGTGWDQISSAGGGATIYSGDGTLSGNRTVSSGGFNLTFAPQTTFSSSLNAATGGSSYSVLGSNALTFAAGFSSSNIGNVYGANGAINAQNFLGNATFAQANLASAMVNVNKIDFGSAGHTITMTQSTAPGIRAMTGEQNQIQFTGSHNGTISHAAISQNLGFFRETGSTRTLTITNAYSFLINPLDDYGSGFTFTNRWGIYQAGTSDKNYFAANVLIGTTTDSGQKLQVNGDTFLKGSGTTSATSALLVQNSNGVELLTIANSGLLTIKGTTNNDTTNIFVVRQQNTNARFFVNALGQTFIQGDANAATDTLLRIERNFNPTSGTATHTTTLLIPTINQTGGANGITRGLYVNPILTAAADWRAIEVSTGVTVLGASTTASATLRVPSGTAPTSPVDGDIWFNGTNLFMRIGGTTKTFTII
jgi:hypothetical protein